MHRIPKSAQRHIDDMQRVQRRIRAATADALATAAVRTSARKGPYSGPVPRYMSLDTTPNEVATAHDVYFNGVKQTLCIVADMDGGFIKRYKTGVGNIPVRGRDGTARTETLRGDVRIVRKGAPLDAE